MEKRITSTIESTRFNAIMYATSDRRIFEEPHTMRGNLEHDEVLKIMRKSETDKFRVADIDIIGTEEKKYGMLEKDFVKYAARLSDGEKVPYLNKCITRTITRTNVKFLCMNKVKREQFTQVLCFSGNVDDEEKLLKEARKRWETKEIRFVMVDEIETKEDKYYMTVETFLAHAEEVTDTDEE